MPNQVTPLPAPMWRTWAAYLLMLLAGGGLVLLVLHLGAGLRSPVTGTRAGQPVAPAAPAFAALLHVLLALATILVVARGLGALFARLRQPAVMGEVTAGILLGPSLLGQIAPGVQVALLPPQVAPYLGVLAQVGVVLYMFLVGLELDLASVRKRSRTAVAISHASIVVPFVLGTALALFLYPREGSREVPFAHFALFCGVAMSITAFPVLARILTDRGAQGSALGAIALTCAAVDDVTAWCLLAALVGFVGADPASGATTALLAVGYLALMLVGVRPLLARIVRASDARGHVDRNTLTALLALLLLSALCTEAIGVHALFGAFVLGALVPADSTLARQLLARLGDFVVVFFLPAFFAYTGMRTELGLVQGAAAWLTCGLIVVVACAGKLGGTYAAARLNGLVPRDAAALGVLMNTRGLMELIVLNIGLDLGILSPPLFAMFVVMALVTTFATTPVLDWLNRGGDLWTRGG